MKKTFFILSTLFVVIIYPTIIIGQTTVSYHNQAINVKNFHTYQHLMDIEYEISIDYPISGPQPLCDSVRSYILKNIFFWNDLYNLEIKDKILKVPQAEKDVNQLLETSGRKFFRAIMKLHADDGFSTSHGYEQKIKLIDQTTKYVSYGMDGYDYYGGAAHPYPWKSGVSFNHKNGKKIVWEDLFAQKDLKFLNPFIDYCLRAQYYAEYGDVEYFCDQSELLDNASSPVLTQTGITVFFMAGAIGPYSLGQPHCTIPYNIIVDYMSPLGKSLTNQY